MDFFQFLQKSTDNSDNSKKNNKRKIKTTDVKHKQEIQQVQLQEPTTSEIQQTHLYIHKGDMVKIIGVPNSILNNYKGYIGEIKDYKRDQDFALVFLHGITALSIIKFPLTHLIKFDPFER